jgi:hypothetical protein
MQAVPSALNAVDEGCKPDSDDEARKPDSDDEARKLVNNSDDDFSSDSEPSHNGGFRWQG